MKYLVTHADNSTRIIEAPNAGLARMHAVDEAAAQHGIAKNCVHCMDLSDFGHLGWDRRLIISSVREVPNEKGRSA